MKLIIIFIFLVGCVKDYQFNPYTSILQQLIKSEITNGEKKK